MIQVTIDVIPFGDESRRETIKRVDIINDTTGSQAYGNYIYRINGEDKGFIISFPRRFGAIALVCKVLKEVNNRHDG
jgi:hypothetical protein